MTNFYWVNDELVPESQAQVSVLDHGFTVADGVFETIKVVDGQTFARTLHLDRLERSCNGIGLVAPHRELANKAIDEVLNAGEFLEFGRVRVTITSGVGPLGSDRTSGRQTFVVAATQQSPWPADASIALVPWVRNERSASVGLKTTSYIDNVIALEAAHKAQCSEAIFLDTRGNVSEGTGSNIFWVKGDCVFTPSASTGLLKGITRDLVIELCARSNIALFEGEFSIEELSASDEVFITSSTRDVMPVTSMKILDGNGIELDLITFRSGSITKMLMGEFGIMSQANPDPSLGEFSR